MNGKYNLHRFLNFVIHIWFVDIDGDFKMQLEDLAPLLLEPGKLVVKTINGNSVTGKDLLEYFKV